MRSGLDPAAVRTWVSLAASSVMVIYGVVTEQSSFIAMGVGVLGAPSISVVVAKDEEDDDETH